MTNTDTITLLTGDRAADRYYGRYAKLISGGAPKSASFPTHHTVQLVEVADLAGLRRVLEAQRRQHATCVIRGAPVGEARSGVRRDLEAFEDKAHRYLGLDADGIPLPEGIDWRREPTKVIQHTIRTYLPAGFHDAACYWQWSASMGYKPGLRAHLWFWLAVAADCERIQRWLWSHGHKTVTTRAGAERAVPLLPFDPALYRPVQPHYTADPIEPEGQLVVPYRHRTGWIEGGEVELVDGFDDPPAGRISTPRPWTSKDTLRSDRIKSPRSAPIGFVNHAIPIDDALELAGYIKAGGRYLWPGSDSGSPGVVVDRETGHCYSHHGSGDPLAEGSPRWKDSYDVLRIAAAAEYPGDEDQQRWVTELAKERTLAAFGDRYALCRPEGSKHYCAMEEIVEDIMGYRDEVLQYTVLTSLADRYANEPLYTWPKKDDAPTKSQLVKAWKEWDGRTTFDRIVFDPEPDPARGGREKVYNLFKGWPISRKKGGRWDRFRFLVEEICCGGDPVLIEWAWDWIATLLQHPKTRYGVMLVLIGGKGVGKTKFADVLMRLLGRYALRVNHMSRLTSNFNAHLMNKLLIHAEEATWGGDKSHESVLKDMITGDTLTLERKGVDAIKVPNMLRFLVTANPGWVVPVDGMERRYLVLEVGDQRQQDHAWFAGLDAELAAGGYEALMDWLMAREITTDQRQAPWTEALMEQGHEGMKLHEQWLLRMLQRGYGYGFDDPDFPTGSVLEWQGLNGHRWPGLVRTGWMRDDYIRFVEREQGPRRGYRAEVLTEQGFGKFMGKVLQVATGAKSAPGGKKEARHEYRTTRRVNGRKENVYKLPTLEEMREAFDRLHGRQIWNDEMENSPDPWD